MPRKKSTPPTGWIQDPAEVDATTVSMGGDSVLFGNSEFNGYAQRQMDKGQTGVFPHLAEKTLFGRLLPAFHQRRGTCVGQGTTRAIQDSWFHSLVTRGVIGRPVELVVAYIYAGSRVQIGGGRISGDGSIGAWAAKFASLYGALERKVHGQYDLSKPREDLSVSWGAPGRGVPSELIEIGKRIDIRAFRCTSERNIVDAAWAGFGLAFCGNRTYGPKNKDGISRLSQGANHCTEAVGACLSSGGNVLIGGQQSWGQNSPSGTNQLRYKGGVVPLRAGMCFVPVEDYWNQVRGSGEMWAFQVNPHKGFRPKVA